MVRRNSSTALGWNTRASLMTKRATLAGSKQFIRMISTGSWSIGDQFLHLVNEVRLKQDSAALTENTGGFCSEQTLCATSQVRSSNGTEQTLTLRTASTPSRSYEKVRKIFAR